MKFNLTMSKAFFNENDIEDYKKIGFKFEKDGLDYYCIRNLNLTIEINTLEELINFVKTYGKIVFCEDGIEIYNDYRE